MDEALERTGPRPLRVGYVVKRYPRYSETFIVNEILAHEEAGLDLEIFALRPPVDTHFQDVIARVRAPVHYLRHAGLRAGDFWDALQSMRERPRELADGLEAAWGAEPTEVVQALELARELRSRGIGHLHAHFGSSPAAVARLAARFAGIAYSFTAHAKDIFHEEVEPDLLRQKLRDAAAVVTVSDFNLRHLSQLEPAAAAGLARIYNGMDLDTFAFESPVRRVPRILAVGRLVEKKGFTHLMEACRILRDEGRHFECRIVGAGPLEAALAAQLRAAGLEDRVELSGPLPQEEVRRELREAAVFAAPCVIGNDGNRDGLPTTLLESMAVGTPCVSTDVTGIPEVVRHEDTGLQVPQHDAVALASALARLLDDAPLRERLARAARKLIEEQFDVRSNTARLREVFHASRAGAAEARA